MAFQLQRIDYKSLNQYRLKTYDCGYADFGSNWNSNVVNPSFARLYYILESDGWYETSEGRFPLQAGYCYLLPSLFSFRCGCETKMRQFFFHITLLDENDQDVLPFLTSPLTRSIPVQKTEYFFQIMRDKKLTPSRTLLLHSRLLETLSGLFETRHVSFPAREYSPCVKNALSYIQKNISARLTLEEVTVHCFVSQTTLSRHFRQELGITVGRYIDNMVFAQAQCMLRNPNLSIAQISDVLGFCDQFYFSSRFRQRYHVSPQVYRRSDSI